MNTKDSWTAHMERTAQAREINWAAATDAANRSMRNAGRKAWNEDDWNAAVQVLERLDPRD